jgi:hypothetical protein
VIVVVNNELPLEDSSVLIRAAFDAKSSLTVVIRAEFDAKSLLT